MVSQQLPTNAPLFSNIDNHILPTASSSHNDLPNHRVDEPASIPRSPSTFNLSKLAHEPRTSHSSKYRYSETSASADQSDCSGSENSQVLYMESPSERSRKLRSSLSSVGNHATCKMNSLSDIKGDTEECSISEKFAWNLIDREIFEWQYVCRTGRPYWWSPETKYSRLETMPSRFSNETPLHSWKQEIDRRKDLCIKQRRTVSEGYLVGEGCDGDLAHLVAVQLLSSCFTLPLGQDVLPPPDFNSYNWNSPLNLPDPRLISSLRMHTHFRYSPSFGHQARNTSPVQLWSEFHEGLSPALSPPYTATGLQTPVIGSSSSPPRRHRTHRLLNVTENSVNCCWLEGQCEDYIKAANKPTPDLTASASAWDRRQEIDDINARPTTLPYLAGECSGRYQWANARTENDDIDPESYRGTQLCSRSRSPKTNYRLQPVIRSEPHHVFVQPVRELVVKRWKNFRRRFGGSLHSHLPTDSTEFMSETPSFANTGAPGPSIGSDGRARRRRAQERGDIHSSVDSTPHYNSPVSGYGTPNVNPVPNSFWEDPASSSPDFQLADPLAVEAALALAETGASPSSSANTSTPSGSLIQRKILAASSSDSPLTLSQPKLTPTPSSQSYTKRLRRQHQRRSMLSEMHTPEDLAEKICGEEGHEEAISRNIPSAAGNELASPREGTGKAESNLDLVLRSASQDSIGNLGAVGSFSMRRMTVSSEVRTNLRLSRTSTTGTQVFTPSEDGVEIDGLPAGPSKELWDTRCHESGKRRERTYL